MHVLVETEELCFNPRAPRGARPSRCRRSVWPIPFQSTRPTRGATQDVVRLPRVGRCFNPRAPRGARPAEDFMQFIMRMFQSTRPTRGATCLRRNARAHSVFQSTRPTRGATEADREIRSARAVFQSTRPTRGATGSTMQSSSKLRFQSTRPTRGATSSTKHTPVKASFQSTRPTRGATSHPSAARAGLRGFNPRAPRGARREIPPRSVIPILFQSTRPTRGATGQILTIAGNEYVSIHAPHAGRDVAEQMVFRSRTLFQSTRPTRGATFLNVLTINDPPGFNPRAPRGARPPCS